MVKEEHLIPNTLFFKFEKTNRTKVSFVDNKQNKMKYRKGNDLTHNQKIALIAKEMINIETGITYFDDDGHRLAKPKPGHSTYVLDDVSYDVHPNIGVVVVFDKLDGISLAHIQNACSILFNDETIVGRASGVSGTTQYMCMTTDRSDTLYTSYNHNNICKYNKLERSSFVWFVYQCTSCVDSSPLHIPFFNSDSVTQETQLLSLSTIILDCDNVLILEDKHRSPDFPTIHKYQQFVSGYICDRPIRVDAVTGIHTEIASNFLEVTKVYRPAIIPHNIFWIDWDDVDVNHLIECGLDWVEQVKRQALKKDDKYTNDTQPITNKKNYRCIITGIPIYEDCYVLDIYEQKVVRSVNVKDLDTVIANGGVLYNPPKVTGINTKKTTESKTKMCKSNRTTAATRASTKSRKPDQFVDVLVTIRHESPLHVLMSPYGMHCYMKTTGSLYFETITKSKVIVYRSFCPHLAVDVIDSIEEHDTYKKMLNAANISITWMPTIQHGNQILCLFGPRNNFTMGVYKHISMSSLIDSTNVNYIASHCSEEL
jgi:hypothetical protein